MTFVVICHSNNRKLTQILGYIFSATKMKLDILTSTNYKMTFIEPIEL